MDQLTERFASLAHAMWAGWMRYLFSKGHFNEDNTFTIEAESVERWVRQMNTPYKDLSEAEKDSDRQEAFKMLRIIANETKLQTLLKVIFDRFKNSLLTLLKI